jgi:acetoacetyl-CoA synthetase
VATVSQPLWEPSADRIAGSRLTAFARHLRERTGRTFPDYASLHQYSIAQMPEFWSAFWDFASIAGQRGTRVVEGFPRMPGTRFFGDARISFVENILRGDPAATAVVAATEEGQLRQFSYAELERDVRRAAAALSRDGVVAGDRVAGFVANIPEAIVAALGCAAIGAVWSSCSPDFGVQGVLDRFGQIDPAVLIAVDGYRYGGKTFDCRAKLRECDKQLKTVRRTVVIPFANDAAEIPSSVTWSDWLSSVEPQSGPFEPFSFDHPLYILYSSGTTGAPKCIVHGAGGTLLQHLKEHQLHCDVQSGDRVFYFTTCGWMMWNWLLTSLASSAAVVLYDGSPFHPDGRRLFDLVDETGVTLFGVSAKFIDAARKAGLTPARTHHLTTVRTITSTGSPLAAESFEYVYREIKQDVHLASISGGTDIVGLFVGGNPNAPVWTGEIQCACLGMDVHAFDDSGRSVRGEAGELVCKSPFPSMPVKFWNDPDGAKYRAAYFEKFPGVWSHGDWMRFTEHGGVVIYGRSDATLNPGGVRIGTAELYRQVEQLPEVVESVAVGQRWEADERIVLFVRLRDGIELDEALRARIISRIRSQTSPRHVPARVVQVADIPRTKSGKIVELAVRAVIHGQPVKNREALANPEALDLFRDLPDLRE